MTKDTNIAGGTAIKRYKIGYHTDEWGVRSSTPGGITDPSGQWVLYKDHIAALASHGQAPAKQGHEWGCLANAFGPCTCGQTPAQAAPAAAAGTSEFPHEQMDVMALARYKVMPSHESMLHRHVVVAGDGSQQLYIGREVECENMARKFAGAFLDGAFAFHSMLAAAPTTQPAPQQEPSHTAVQLAELVLSDCGHSSNYTPLLDRVAARIDAHVERRLDELRGCLESKPAPQPSPASQGDALDAARYRWLRDSTEWEPFDSAWLNKHDIYGCPTLAMDVAIDAARAAQEGKSHDN